MPTCIAAAVSLRDAHEMVIMERTNSSSEIVSITCGICGLVICLVLVTIATMAVHVWILFEYVNEDKFYCGILVAVSLNRVLLIEFVPTLISWYERILQTLEINDSLGLSVLASWTSHHLLLDSVQTLNFTITAGESDGVCSDDGISNTCNTSSHLSQHSV